MLGAVSKDPDDRPTAHDLLGRLLTKEAAGVAHLAENPQLRWAALAVRNNGPAELGADEVADVWAWVARRRRTRALLHRAAVLAALAAALAGIAATPPVRDLTAALTSADRPATGPTSQPPPPLATITLADPLRERGPWHAVATTDEGVGGCKFHRDGLFIYRQQASAYRCPDRAAASAIPPSRSPSPAPRPAPTAEPPGYALDPTAATAWPSAPTDSPSVSKPIACAPPRSPKHPYRATPRHAASRSHSAAPHRCRRQRHTETA